MSDDITPKMKAARIVRETSRAHPSFHDYPGVRLALEIAARAVERGRHLTAAEQMENLRKAIFEEDARAEAEKGGGE